MDERLTRALRHDLRSPLAVITGRADFLLEGLAGELSDTQRRSVEAIASAADRLRVEIDALADSIESEPAADAEDEAH